PIGLVRAVAHGRYFLSAITRNLRTPARQIVCRANVLESSSGSRRNPLYAVPLSSRAFRFWRTTMRIGNLRETACAAALLVAAFSMPASSAELANAQLKDSSGKAVGDVDLSQTQGGVLIKLQLKGLPP